MQGITPSFKSQIHYALKICKHEFLASRILGVIVCIIMAFNGLIALFHNTESVAFYGLIMIQSFAFVVCGIAYVLSAAISFYQGIFGRHAPLMHALPVYIETIIGAKILIYFMWSLVLLVAFLMAIYVGFGGTQKWIQVILAVFKAMNSQEWLYFWGIVGSLFLQVLHEIVFIFMVVALVHRIKTYMILVGIVSYFGLKVVLLIIEVFGAMMLPNSVMENIGSGLLVYSLYQIFWICVFYFVCHRIIKYNLSL